MIKKIALFLILVFPVFSFAQDYSAQWQGHFSFYDIKDVSQGNNKIYAAAENAIFSYDLETNEIKTVTTINGLSGEIISAIHYSEVYELLIIGYENGLMEIAFDDPEENVLTILDIIDKPTIPPNDKNINHFNEHDGLVYISSDYGISVYDLERLEFGDTYYIGDLGGQIAVKQTVVYDDFIYAACLNGRGIRKAPLSSANLIDYNEWQSVVSGDFAVIESNNDKLYVCRTWRAFYELQGSALTQLIRYDDLPLDLRSINDYLIVTTKNDVFIYDGDFNLVAQVTTGEDLDTEFTSATIDAEFIYIGTKDGLMKTPILNPVEFEPIVPNGPLLNSAFSIKASNNNLWATFGDYNFYYVPTPYKQEGISHLKGEEWRNIPFDSVLTARNLNAIAVNPFVENNVFISSFQDGILEVTNDIPITLLDQTNSGLESLVVPGAPSVISIRQGAADFDRNGLLWTTTARVAKPLKSYDPSTNQWQSFDFSSLIQDPLNDEWGYGDLVIDSNGTKWFGGYTFGLMGYNENNNTGEKLNAIYTEEQNMPSTSVTALAVDNRNQIWFGTNKGLRVLYNTSSFFTEPEPVASEIIILEDGVAEELLFQQFITDIEVDGSNNKWISTLSSGLFYFSSDGQETIYHFTQSNSPLPTNSIIDLSIDDSNGTVYIATENGLVSFKAGGSAALEGLEDAYVYPNPVRPTFNLEQDKVKIKDISENVNIKITDIEGNLVAEAETRTNTRYKGYNLEIDGGTAFWNGKNLANNTVASGVYLIMLSDLDTFETKVLKIMVVR